MMILETKGLKYSYQDGTQAIKGVDVKIKKGKKIAFVGKNGSGKSTLFMLLNGTLKPKEGAVYFHGKPMEYDAKSLREVRKSVGIVFQNSDDQIFAPTVYQDVGFGPTNLGYSKEEVEEKVEQTLEYIGITEFKDKPPHHLSGGQKKRVAIAGVCSMDPEIMILDEPLANLDPVGADEILDLLNELNHNGTTLIISTHDVELAYSWADYVYFMTEGNVIGEGLPEDVFRDADLLRKSYLRQPRTLEIYSELERRNLAVRNRFPTSVPELVNSFKPPELMWIEVSPDVKEGDIINLGVMHGEYAISSPYEAVNAKVLHIHPDGHAIAEMTRHGIKSGGIVIYDTDRYDEASFRKVVAEEDIDNIGAMGKKSKTLAENNLIDLQITSGVIDKSILMALCGKRSLIMTSGGMVEHAVKRIDGYAENSGIAIQLSLANIERDELDL
ncbi:energy-coupling factor ABC transporter ATP-binding protein [Methanococcoides sp. NM1]|uniref:energy-coupling factor ABC transporter ATP-binding protein n=1 Tax=Methanococcoides sp. NM1 TaxID=1201013 RepID=UPI0010845E04|nr:ATP-binding cassette domain-containing protein [Methanococcoides sp. NM1]